MNENTVVIGVVMVWAVVQVVQFAWCAEGSAQSKVVEEEKEFVWGFTDAVHRIFPDQPYIGPLGNQWQLDAARNEYESCQLVLVPVAADLRMAEVFVQILRKRPNFFVTG